MQELPSPNLRRLELGYRTNNPASGKVAAAAGFMIEGIEREKFLYAGQTYDAVTAARLRNRQAVPRVLIHHVELWTADFSGTVKSWDWLMESLEATVESRWDKGISWKGVDGSYIVLEQSSDMCGSHERTQPGMNHLALNVLNRERLDQLRAEASAHGWNELFAEKYPYAGGEENVALYLENAEGFEVELVAG
ncbi:VOC family protein [uncultured Rothia sp.]|uniref:VOC family protein n=1 Tax=uncultured Rothia sp. TaxID=316088 RepID=UPI0032167663